MTVVILDFIGAVLYGFLGVAAILLVAAAKKDGSSGAIGNAILVVGLFSLVMAAAYLILGIMLKGGSSTARVIQMVLSGLAILFGLFGILQTGVDISTILTLAINILIVVLLMGGDASAFFAQSGGGRGGGGRRRRRRR